MILSCPPAGGRSQDDTELLVSIISEKGQGKKSKSILLPQSALRTSKHNKLGPFFDQVYLWPKKTRVLGHFHPKMSKNRTNMHFSQNELDRFFCPFGILNLNILPTFWRIANSLSPILINVGLGHRKKIAVHY